MTQDERIAWAKAACFDVCCWECGTEWGEHLPEERGDCECVRAPGSDICVSCARLQDEIAYYGKLYEAGALGPRRRDYDNAEEFEDAARAWGLRP